MYLTKSENHDFQMFADRSFPVYLDWTAQWGIKKNDKAWKEQGNNIHVYNFIRPPPELLLVLLGLLEWWRDA